MTADAFQYGAMPPMFRYAALDSCQRWSLRYLLVSGVTRTKYPRLVHIVTGRGRAPSYGAKIPVLLSLRVTLPACRRKRLARLAPEQPLDPPGVGGRRADFFIEQSADPGCLVPAQVALWTLGPQNLAGAGHVKSALSAFVGLDLGHLVLGTSVRCARCTGRAGSRARRDGHLVRRQDDAE